MRVAILGASGFIGRELVAKLTGEHDVIAVARKRPEPADSEVRWVEADMTRPEDAERALLGAEVAVHLIHSLGSSDYEQRDLLIAGNVARSAERAGLGQIVYLSGLGDDRAEVSNHLRSRRETGERLSAGSVPVTTLRAGVVIGRGSAAFETIVALVDRLPAMICPRWVSTPTQPIALDDVIAYLAAVIGLAPAIGQRYDVGGSEIMTYRSMIDRIAAIRGKRIFIVEVPVLTPRLSSWWLHLVTPVKAAIARPLIDGLRNPTVVEDDQIRTLVPFERTPFDKAVRDELSAP